MILADALAFASGASLTVDFEAGPDPDRTFLAPLALLEAGEFAAAVPLLAQARTQLLQTYAQRDYGPGAT